ncbi:hypothetical protein PUR71_11365 [Streptomyces sp. SP17BM10]|uniref:hypothetical protein n=1 Tax=Streptomyces sp. SP17BM10 TaxID=3002530 RepID=UPI002E75C1B4|nr:hypothetical protein [Streptomyces sp. SP17BM10]MEE1783501.1 hypothetical protein [Streptomyces sp. SP17BM10]
MADETGYGWGRTPVVWALAVREAADGPPLAEVVVEVGAGLHADLLANAVESGFVLAAGEPPATSGVVEVGGGRLERLVLVGGREVWEPDEVVAASPTWLAVAAGRGAAVVVLVPPGTWPPGLMDLDPEDRVDVFTQRLEEARTEGRVLHGLASLKRAPAG